jgi:YesN/AraC family two-component response regulator
MPIITGLDIVRKVKAKKSKHPIIVLSVVV